MPTTTRPDVLALAAAACLTLAGAPAARAQGAARPARPVCDSAAASRPVDTGTDTLFLTAGPVPGAPVPTRQYLQTVVDAVGDELRLPGALTSPVFGYVFRPRFGRIGSTRPGLAVTLVAELGRDGRLARLTSTQRSLSDSVDLALARAVRAADAGHAFFARDDGPRTLGVSVRLTLWPDSAEVRRPAVLLRQPRYSPADHPEFVGRLPGPTSAEARNGWSDGRGQQVVFEAVVDVNGLPVPGTLRLVEAGSEAYAVELFDWLQHSARFAPGRIAGCAVRQLARFSVTVVPEPPAAGLR